MTITICGSAAFIDHWTELQKSLEDLGFAVHTQLENGVDDARRVNPNFVMTPALQAEATRASYRMIGGSDAILVANYTKYNIHNYIGANTLIEMGYALALRKAIFLLHQIPDVSYRPEIEMMQPIILNGDVSAIQRYYEMKK